MNLEAHKIEVYQPAEDTFLLLEAALKEARKKDRAIEIGCGMGMISEKLATLVESLVATDINPNAVKYAKSCGLDAVRADLFRGIIGEFDLAVFNPPYLPTSEEERVEGWINRALDGGIDGRETIFRFLEELSDHLSPKGRALLLVSSLSGLEEVREKAKKLGFCVEVVACKRYFFEQLVVFRITIACR